jgi:diguanylate cyclase (GGDEF)-like protein
MNIFKYLPKSLGLIQSIVVLLASFVVAMVLSLLFLKVDLVNQKQETKNLTQEILTAVEAGATNAVWTLDSDLANQVITSMMALGNVEKASLMDDKQTVLAEDKKTSDANSGFTRWFAQKFIGDSVAGHRDLYLKLGQKTRKVGKLSVELSSYQVADKFLDLAVGVLITGLAQAFLIALALLWLSSKLVTKPLTLAANTIANIDPENPLKTPLPVPDIHKQNELGGLLRDTNIMLGRLANTQKQLRQLATRDPLTNQPNRTLITDRLNTAITRAKRKKSILAVLFLDLDRFKHVNDSLGHDIGDILLVDVAARLKTVMRESDSIGRLGGDEFLIVLEEAGSVDSIIKIVQRITDILSEPLLLQGHDIRTSASVGIAIYPEDGEDTTTLMRAADLAMYEAKSSPTPWHFFSKGMLERVESRLTTEAQLRNALEEKLYSLEFQPKLFAENGKVAGCEALLRMQTEERSISAGEFIHIAEDNGTIVEIGAWVLEEACRQVRSWNERFEPIPIAINVSARQLQEKDFATRALAIIKRYGIDTRLIEFEITETILLGSLENNIKVLKELREAGITISVDDFGTGYSSLSYLTELPIDSLKIDRSFVSGPKRSSAILEMIISMAQTLNLTTVAEGVETQEQMDWLVEKQCDLLQGYFISRPITPDKFEQEFLSPSPKRQ